MEIGLSKIKEAILFLTPFHSLLQEYFNMEKTILEAKLNFQYKCYTALHSRKQFS